MYACSSPTEINQACFVQHAKHTRIHQDKLSPNNLNGRRPTRHWNYLMTANDKHKIQEQKDMQIQTELPSDNHFFTRNGSRKVRTATKMCRVDGKFPNGQSVFKWIVSFHACHLYILLYHLHRCLQVQTKKPCTHSWEHIGQHSQPDMSDHGALGGLWNPPCKHYDTKYVPLKDPFLGLTMHSWGT